MTQPTALPSDPKERVRLSAKGTNHVVYSPNARLLATSDVRMNVYVHRGDELVFSANYENENPKIRSADRIRALAFSPDGSRLWIAGGDTLHVVDLETGREVWNYVPPRSFGFLVVSPIALSVASDGSAVAAFDNGSIAIWSADGSMRGLLHDNDAPRVLTLTHDGSVIVGTDSFTLCAWDAATRKKTLRRRLPDRAFGMAVDRSGTLVATRHLSQVTLYDLSSGDVVRTMPVEAGLPLLDFHPTQRVLAIGSRNAVELVALETGESSRHEIEGVTVVSFGFSPDGRELTVGCSDEVLRRFQV